MLGNAIPVETGELAQCIPVRDAFSQFAIIPVFYSHQEQGTYYLLCGQPVSPGLGILQATLKIPAHLVYQATMLVNEIGDRLQHRFEAHALGEELHVGKTDLAAPGSCHFLAS